MTESARVSPGHARYVEPRRTALSRARISPSTKVEGLVVAIVHIPALMLIRKSPQRPLMHRTLASWEVRAVASRADRARADRVSRANPTLASRDRASRVNLTLVSRDRASLVTRARLAHVSHAVLAIRASKQTQKIRRKTRIAIF